VWQCGSQGPSAAATATATGSRSDTATATATLEKKQPKTAKNNQKNIQKHPKILSKINGINNSKNILRRKKGI
jgi:hypothetical protein